jgi:hypothetical protein
MSFVQRQAAHCDQCSHEWLVVGASTPTHCAKCKSRRWNTKGAVAQPDRAQDLREICAGNILGVKYEPVLGPIEIPICGKRWWEDGTQYECLMDKGHRDQKHGLRGMVQRLEE